MNIIEAIILGLIQGLTEFIPISSSGHLVIAHEFLGVSDNALAFDVALHFGTLLALLIYFHRDIIKLFDGLRGRGPYKRLVWLLGLATVPAVIAGVLLESAAESTFRSIKLVAINLMVVAIIMLLAEHYASKQPKRTELEQVNPKQAAVIGLAQAAAIVPGVSRSGSTITAGLFFGLDRIAATRFSFLLGIPIITGAVIKVLLEPGTSQAMSQDTALFVVGVLTALLSGLLAIRFLLRYLAHHTLAAFAYYRLVLGGVVLLTALLR